MTGESRDKSYEDVAEEKNRRHQYKEAGTNTWRSSRFNWNTLEGRNFVAAAYNWRRGCKFEVFCLFVN